MTPTANRGFCFHWPLRRLLPVLQMTTENGQPEYILRRAPFPMDFSCDWASPGWSGADTLEMTRCGDDQRAATITGAESAGSTCRPSSPGSGLNVPGSPCSSDRTPASAEAEKPEQREHAPATHHAASHPGSAAEPLVSPGRVKMFDVHTPRPAIHPWHAVRGQGGCRRTGRRERAVGAVVHPPDPAPGHAAPRRRRTARRFKPGGAGQDEQLQRSG